jgi:hypothetical protein
VRRIDMDGGELPERPDVGDPVDPGDPLPPQLQTWSRLEPLPLSTDILPALQAGVEDPLWMLARQWQFLEFAGEDAGTPIELRLEGEAAVLSRFLPGAIGADAATRARDLRTSTTPLESVVEAEPARAAHAGLAAEAGLHLVRMLTAAQLATHAERIRAAFPLAIAADDASEGADRAGHEWLELARGRAIDARTLVTALRPLVGANNHLTGLPPALAGLPSTVTAVLERWLTWYGGDLVDPTRNAAWVRDRFEYSFAVATRTSAGEVVLVADQYRDGTLDWYSVSAAPSGSSLGATATAHTPLKLRPLLPAPVEYAGKPSDRFWEFEDSEVHFGAIDAGVTDLTRLLLVEFALVYGNDWFVAPVRLPVGSLFRATKFQVRDTFGVVTDVGPSRDTDGTPWSLFGIGGVDGFFLAPTVAGSATGDPIEQVALIRDEMANLAWGVERRVAGVSGAGYDRTDEASRRAASQAIDTPVAAAQLAYRLMTPVPEHWIPLVPVARTGSSAAAPVVDLHRAAVLRTEADGHVRRVEPRGVVLGGSAPLRVAEEEVPREGAIVERVFQHARWFDGRSLVWLGRRKTVGRGEGSSGLRFDALDRR